MMEINNKYNTMTDNAFVETIGQFIKHHRLEQNKTQSQLAEEAGINRSTLSEFEQGKRSNIITLIQLLRALNLLQVLQHFEISTQISPIKLAELEQAKRKRASKQKESNKPKSDW
jgi:transcriptional regulator with XRE-family HTH domain